MVFTLCSVIPMMAEQRVEVQAVLNILRNLYGHKIISSSMANVDWNCTEAENRHKGLAPVSRRNKEFGLATANPKERD
jgi:hypothetical protein